MQLTPKFPAPYSDITNYQLMDAIMIHATKISQVLPLVPAKRSPKVGKP